MSRQFGICADPILSGTSYDDLAVGKVIPPPAQAWPVTDIQVTDGASTRERINEMRGGRGTQAPLAGQRTPSVTVKARAYPELLTTLLYMGLGATSRTGTSPAAFTDKVLPAADSANYLPGAHLSWEGDGLFEQAAGAKLQKLSCTFPQGEDGQLEAEFVPLWHKQLTTAPSPEWVRDFDYLTETGAQEWVLQLRDAQAFEGGSPTPLSCLREFNFELSDIYRDPDWCGHRNREDLGTGADFSRWHWPDEYRRAPRRTVSGSIELRGVELAREQKIRALKAEQLVVELDGRPMATTPPLPELLRIVLAKQVMQREGARTINRDDDLNTSLNWSAHVDDTGKDVEIDYVNARPSGIVVPA